MTRVKSVFFAIIVIFTLVSCAATETRSPISTDNPSGLYLDGGESKIGVVLCHGRGGNPSWYVVGPLHRDINRQLGYHTLSIEMPGGDKAFDDFALEFPGASVNIQAAIDYLRNEKGVDMVYLIGHSMGARMVTSYLLNNPMEDLAGFIGVAMLNNGGYPYNSAANLKNVTIPVLDIYGEDGQLGDVEYAKERRYLLSDKYQMVMVPRADHAFSDSAEELSVEVIAWLKKRNEQQAGME